MSDGPYYRFDHYTILGQYGHFGQFHNGAMLMISGIIFAAVTLDTSEPSFSLISRPFGGALMGKYLCGLLTLVLALHTLMATSRRR